MSEENVETVRRYNDAWNRRDVTAWLALLSSGAEVDWSRSRGPLKGVYRGPGELEVFWDAVLVNL
jgi:ketosteroid isomerase-like protein